MFLWVPTALWGLAAYVAIGALAWMGLTPRNWPIAFALAAGGVGFSAYLTWLSVFDLGATCVWCLTSAVILIAILAVLVMRRPAARNRKPAMSSARLATNGGLAAVGAVVAAAFVFAAPFSAPPGYQSALAQSPRRHEGGDVRRILVTGVPRAKGPVRARDEGHPVRGV